MNTKKSFIAGALLFLLPLHFIGAQNEAKQLRYVDLLLKSLEQTHSTPPQDPRIFLSRIALLSLIQAIIMHIYKHPQIVEFRIELDKELARRVQYQLENYKCFFAIIQTLQEPFIDEVVKTILSSTYTGELKSGDYIAPPPHIFHETFISLLEYFFAQSPNKNRICCTFAKNDDENNNKIKMEWFTSSLFSNINMLFSVVTNHQLRAKIPRHLFFVFHQQ